MTQLGRSSLEPELLSRGLVSPEALAEARALAQVRNHTLVETLLERKDISEDVLVDLFHKKLGFPLVDDTYFDKLDIETLQLVPKAIAVAYRVLPLYRSGDKLFVAAVDPLENSLSEVASAAHHQLIVCVAKPSSVMRALALRYNTPTPLLGGPPPVTLPQVPPPVTLQPKRAKARLEPLPEPIRDEISPLTELFKHTPPTINTPPDRRSAATAGDDFERARVELINAPERDSIGRILSVFVARYFPRVVLLAHKQGMLFGWQSVGTDLSAGRLKGLIVPLHLPSVFQHSVQHRTYHTGRIEPGMLNSAFLAAIGDKPAGHAIIVPILVDRRVATVLYADTAGGEAPATDLSFVYRLCEETGPALNALIRRQRGQ